MKQSLSIIIPARNEGERIGPMLAYTKSLFADAEFVVVDGDSRDNTAAQARSLGANVISSHANRGAQLRRGAEQSSGRNMLFLHADSVLAPNAYHAVNRFLGDPKKHIGTFYVRFDSGGLGYRIMEWLARRDSVLTTYGDQGLLVRREAYDAIGGFSSRRLFEDVELMQRARKHYKVEKIDCDILTSSGKFAQHGVFTQHAWNTGLHALYHLGASSETLEAMYKTEPFRIRHLFARLADNR